MVREIETPAESSALWLSGRGAALATGARCAVEDRALARSRDALETDGARDGGATPARQLSLSPRVQFPGDAGQQPLQRVTLKYLLPFADVAEERRLLHREAYLQELAKGDGVVPILGGGNWRSADQLELDLPRTDASTQWNVLLRPFAPGLPLLDLLRQGAAVLSQADCLVSRIASVLHRLHEGPAAMIHRDLTPGNILVSEEGDVWLTDFGLSRLLSEGPLPDLELLQGTPSSLPPEVLLGQQPGPESDIFQLGIVAALVHSTSFRQLYLEAPRRHERRIDRARRLALNAEKALSDHRKFSPCLARAPGARPAAGELLQLC